MPDLDEYTMYNFWCASHPNQKMTFDEWRVYMLDQVEQITALYADREADFSWLDDDTEDIDTDE